MKNIIIIFSFFALSFSLFADYTAPGTELPKTSTFKAEVICVPYLGPKDYSIDLGNFFTGHDYTEFHENVLTFELRSQAGMIFDITTETTTADHGVIIEYKWYINSATPEGSNSEYSGQVTIPDTDLGTCNETALLVCEVTKLKVPGTGITPGNKTFNVTVNASMSSW